MELTRLLAPRSVAVLGATERPDAYGSNVIENLERHGFEGDVYGVNPRRRSVHGRPCVPSLHDLPEPVDALVVAIPAAQVPEAIRMAARLGCGGAVVLSAGFGEVSSGRGLDAELRSAAAESGLPVCGPNGNGVFSLTAHAPLWGDAVRPLPAGPVALVSQSGNIAVNALNSRRGIGFHTVVSTGNSAVLDSSDWLAALAEQPGVRSVALFCEGDGDGERLAEALARCAELGVGVAVLKAGGSLAGARAAEAHTGAIAGDARVFRALVEEAGAAWADDPHELLELARALSAPRARPTGAGETAILTCSGGDSSLSADLAERAGLELAELSPPTLERLAELLPEAATAGNPLDYTATIWGQRERLREIARAVGDDPAVDQLLLFFDDSPDLRGASREAWTTTRDGLVEGAELSGAAPLVASTLPDLIDLDSVAALAARGVPTVAGLGAAISATRALRQPGQGPERLRQLAAAAAALKPAGPAGASAGLAGSGELASANAPPGSDPSRGWLSEADSKRLLRRAGIEVPPGEVCVDADEALVAARRLGWPLAAKLSAPGLLHKSELGAIELGIGDETSLRAAVERLRALGFPEAGLLVERMVPAGLELIVAARADGVVPVLALGLGGIWAEALDDIVLVPLPASPERVSRALGRLRGASLLRGGRGRGAVDADALARLASAAGKLLLSERLELVELNPVIVSPHGCVAADALIRRLGDGAASRSI